jgi:hypothetical protein
MSNELKTKLYDVLSGKSEVRNGEAIQAITNYLRQSQETSTDTKGTKLFKEQEKQRLELFITLKELWLEDIDFTKYVSEGAEQKVYLKDSISVLKLNDSIYYECWIDYFYNLLLHNYFFEDTAYKLIGFTKEKNQLFAVVEQNYVEMTQATDLNLVKDFLLANGFESIKNNDYVNNNIGIIIEDLHDENVLTKDGLLYFIDTVFFIKDKFWENYKTTTNNV